MCVDVRWSTLSYGAVATHLSVGVCRFWCPIIGCGDHVIVVEVDGVVIGVIVGVVGVVGEHRH